MRKVRDREERFLVAYKKREDEQKKRNSEAEGAEADGKRREEASDNLDDAGAMIDLALGGGVIDSSRDNVGGPSSSSGANMQGVEEASRPEAEEAQREGMDIGFLQRLACHGTEEFKSFVREMSLCETAQLLLEEEVDARKVQLQIGAISSQRAYSFEICLLSQFLNLDLPLDL